MQKRIMISSLICALTLWFPSISAESWLFIFLVLVVLFFGPHLVNAILLALCEIVRHSEKRILTLDEAQQILQRLIAHFHTSREIALQQTHRREIKSQSEWNERRRCYVIEINLKNDIRPSLLRHQFFYIIAGHCDDRGILKYLKSRTHNSCCRLLYEWINWLKYYHGCQEIRALFFELRTATLH